MTISDETLEKREKKLSLRTMQESEEFKNRVAKVTEIRRAGIDPYPASFKPSARLDALQTTYKDAPVGDHDAAQAGTTPATVVAGRVVLFRPMGKNAFLQLQDETGRLQVMLSRDATELVGYEIRDEVTPLKFLEKHLDLGDFIGVEGHLFRTQRGELTVFGKRVTFLCKAVLPLPDKHAGLADPELRYRKRWLDMISDPTVIQRFEKRSLLIKTLRQFMDKQNFTEVETPVLQHSYGGAEAQPFVTELLALHEKMYLRISLEISLKKLITGGMERVYEIGKVFRNEGIDRTHNPEFTEFEAYAAYWDYFDMMRFVEEMCHTLAKAVLGTSQVQFGDKVVDFTPPWKRVTMKGSLLEYAQLDVDKQDDEALRELLKQCSEMPHGEIKTLRRGELIATLFAELVEPKLIEPHHIYDHPIETTPLCKLHREPKQRAERLVERFETFCFGMEIANSYSELNDPILQRELLEAQAKSRKDAMPVDEEFIEAVSNGMPPHSGVGMGIDRLVMMLTNSPTIKEVIFFPLLRKE